MKKFIDIAEAPKTVAMTYGRFNPPTIGHEKLITKLSTVRADDYKVYASHSQNPKRDPLQYAKKIAYMKKSFPKHKKNIVVSEARTIFDILTELNKTYQNIVIVAGSDRVTEFKTLSNKYNGVESKHGYYKFDNIQVISAGERDPDAEGATGMSASKMRAAAQDNDFDSFKQGTPLPDAQAKKLYFDVRKSMGIREELDMNDPEVLRDLYLSEQIWNVGELVSVDDKPYEIIRKGTNYVTVIDETYKTHKFWLHELTMYELSGTALKRVSQAFKDKGKDMSHGRMFTFLSGLMKTRNHTQLRKDLKGFISRNIKMKSDILRVLNTYLQPHEVRYLTEKKAEDEAPKKTKQDKDIKDREGTQPAKYYAKDAEGDKLSKATKQARARHFAKYGKKDPDSDAAYKPAPGDKGGKTKPSKHTKKFKQMYGEAPRIPRKKGQPAKSDKHSDLYTDEDPRGTIHGLGFKDVETAKASVSKIERSDRTHAHKIQAAVAMEQRAKEMGKKAEAAIYRAYIEKMKIKTKKMNESLWDNIRKKKERIKRGSGERMRKKGEKGSPTAAQMKRAQEQAPDTDDAMKRYKAGKAGFTDIAHLKAKGLIKRADGTKRKSAKYEIKEEFKFFPDNMEEYIQIPPPPQDEQQEMATVRKFVSTRTDEDVESVKNHDNDSKYAIKEYMKKIGIAFHKDELKGMVLQTGDTIDYFKKKFNRKRPFEIDGNLDVLGSKTNKTRSYPSGHSAQGMVVALYASSKFPEHRDKFMEAAKEVGMGRVKAGFHFLSDHVAGQMLGRKMYEMMSKEDYGQAMKEYYELGTDNYVNYLKDITPGEEKKKDYEQVNSGFGFKDKEPMLNEWGEVDEEAEYQGRKVKLNNPVRGGNKKFYVYVRNEKGNVIKVSFGDTTGLDIKRDDPARRKAFRARHNCDNPGPKTKARYWSCKFWEKGKTVTDLVKG